MNTSSALRPLSSDPVSSDFLALASHMSSCDRSRDRLFHAGVVLDRMHAVAAPRIVSVGLGFAVLALAVTWLI